MKRFFALLSMAALVFAATCCTTDSGDQIDSASGTGTIVCNEYTWKNVGFISSVQGDIIYIHFVPEGLTSGTTQSWLLYNKNESDAAYQYAFQLPDFDEYPARGYVGSVKGGITKVDDTHYKVDVSGTWGSGDKISFKGTAITK